MLFCLLTASSVMLPGTTAKASSVDPAFHAVPSAPIPNANSIQQIVQPDGKIIVWGASLVADGVAKGELLRLNADGTVDQTFAFCGCGILYITSVALLPDGKIIVAGGDGVGRMIRLNSDGSIDPAFVSGMPANPFGNSVFDVVAIQPDGKILASRRQSMQGFVDIKLFRFNPEGSVDTTFTAIAMAGGSPAAATVGGLIFLPDGRFYFGWTQGTFGTAGTLRRYNADGTVDSTWETPNFTGGGFPTSTAINGIALEADGSLIVAGKWDTVNGLSKPNLIRLFSAGNVDVSFSPPVTGLPSTAVAALPGGKILFSQQVDTQGFYRLFRLNTDGSADNTFVMDASITSVSNRWVRAASGNIIFLGLIGQQKRLVRLLPDGALDNSFDPNLAVFGTIHTMLRQNDGKIVSAGSYTQMNGVARPGFARSTSDGDLDPSFVPGTGFDLIPSALVSQSDGKIIAVGGFTTYNGAARPSIARINFDGSLDSSFAPNVSSIAGIAIQPDGKIIIVGSFTSVNGVPKTRIARLETNGALDSSFDAIIGSGAVYRALVQPDGKIMIGGSFTGVNGFNRNNLARLNADGTLDQTFNASSSGVSALLRQSDGKYIVGGTASIARKNVDGSNDASFVSTNFSASSSSDIQIHAVLLRPDGSLIVGGRFDTVGGTPKRNLARLAPNGELDKLFLSIGANGRVRAVVEDSDNKILIGGDFTSVENTPQPGISRLVVSPFRAVTPYDFDGDGKADISVFRPSENKWYILRSSDFGVDQPVFAVSGDIPVPADYDGDGKTDLAVFRPSLGDWWYRGSANNAQTFAHWGNSSDTALPSDWDGDGRADYVVFRAGANTWYRASSANSLTSSVGFGVTGDKPLIGDFDGDGKSDVAVFRPSTGDWWWQSSIDNIQRATRWGISTDIAVPADYDGDGKTDFAVYRPSNGNWYILNSSNFQPTIVNFGLSEDKPVAADYDGDGKADIAVFRPSTGVWYLLRTTDGFAAFNWGVSTDIPIPNAYLR